MVTNVEFALFHVSTFVGVGFHFALLSGVILPNVFVILTVDDGRQFHTRGVVKHDFGRRHACRGMRGVSVVSK